MAREPAQIINRAVLDSQRRSAAPLRHRFRLRLYGVVLGSWGSNSKYSLLGGLRSSAMMISYEISMGLAILGLILIIGSLQPEEIVDWQADNYLGRVVQPVGFLLFLVAMFAETGRTPFDVAEGESEIVGGFHTEYSSIKFALFFMGEYAHMVIASALMATLFLGGYDLLPFLASAPTLLPPILGWCARLAFWRSTGLVFFGFIPAGAKQKARRCEICGQTHAAKSRRNTAFFGRRSYSCGCGLCWRRHCLGYFYADSRSQFGGNRPPGWVGFLTALVQIGIVLGQDPSSAGSSSGCAGRCRACVTTRS